MYPVEKVACGCGVIFAASWQLTPSKPSAAALGHVVEVEEQDAGGEQVDQGGQGGGAGIVAASLHASKWCLSVLGWLMRQASIAV